MDRIAVRPFGPTARSQRAELAAIRICYAAALNGKFRCCCQLLERGDATRWHGAHLSEHFWIDCGSHDRRVHGQLKHTQAAVVREKRDDGTCDAPILPMVSSRFTPLLKIEWVEMDDPAPPRRRTHGGTCAGTAGPCQALAAEGGGRKARLDKGQASPATIATGGRWAAVQDHALAPSLLPSATSPIQN
jgi:hypothetical protein